MNKYLLPAARDLSVDAFRAAHKRHVRQKIADEMTHYDAVDAPDVGTRWCECWLPAGHRSDCPTRTERLEPK